jgi:hypothetical protein
MTKKKMRRTYTYRNLPCTIVLDDQLWHVCGRDIVDGGGGVLEWCYDEADARAVFDRMLASGEFEKLSFGKYREASR